MDAGTWLWVIALTILVASYIARPLIEKKALPISQEARRISMLQAERERLLSNLQELEMDFAIGKMANEEYQAQRSELISRGASILRQLDELSKGAATLRRGVPVDRAAGGMEALEAQIERAVARRRRTPRAAAAGFCAQCGNQVLDGDRFCARCGAALAGEMPKGEGRVH